MGRGASTGAAGSECGGQQGASVKAAGDEHEGGGERAQGQRGASWGRRGASTRMRVAGARVRVAGARVQGASTERAQGQRRASTSAVKSERKGSECEGSGN
jgi:hypothetical protein